ncbi:MAG: thiol reductant ABC exporter subunit CydD [Microbacteriaceae bacterium]|nr:thiol reductant ABC exporter subunit CydD [Microbacteriaceae bacterium]MCI1206780.1 thiol reductant ABC exporter subunit CydD [Microbacteriaceae bacterium]
MKPFDVRLLRYARDSRWFLALSGVLGLIQTACIIVFSASISVLIVDLFLHHDALWRTGTPILLAIGAVCLRGASAWAWDAASRAAATRVKRSLREQIAESLSPRMLRGRSSADMSVIAGRGLDALDAYFSRYLPQLVLSGIATPIVVLVLWSQDVRSGLITIITLPLIPVFMILVGYFTQNVQQAEWETLRRLSAHFLDVVSGLTTLRIFGRVRHQQRVIAQVADRYRERTMRVLRVSFLSGFVLEILSTLSVAVVAVSIGTRLVAGQLDLFTGLFVLLLVPEAFTPIRMVGAQYHAAQEGVQASTDVFEILDARGAEPQPAEPLEWGSPVSLQKVCAEYGDVVTPPCSLELRPGELTALTGPSGTGKSSVFAVLLGFVPGRGLLRSGARTIDLRSAHARSTISWAGQRPELGPGTVRQNVALGMDLSDMVLERALRLAALPDLPADRVLGELGSGVSGGQAQRLALARAYARALIRQTPLLLLDEPTSALDSETEAAVIAGWRELANEGFALCIITHREEVASVCDVRHRLVREETAHV